MWGKKNEPREAARTDNEKELGLIRGKSETVSSTFFAWPRDHVSQFKK